MKIKQGQYYRHYDNEIILINEVKEVIGYDYEGPRKYNITFGNTSKWHNFTEKELLKSMIPISNEEAALYKLKQ